MKTVNEKKRKNFLKTCILLVIIAGLLILSVYLFPYFAELADEQKRNELVEFIRNKGVLGVLILIGLQVLQVVVAVIPGEIIEVAAGIIFGTIGGYIICTVGVVLSTVIVYYSVKKLGKDYIQKAFASEKLQKFKFLHDAKKLQTVIFILYFIPGTPKDMLTYIIPFTSIKPMHFFVLSTVARIPSIISSTYAGANLIEGNYINSIIVFAITGTLGILGIMYRERILEIMHKLKK